QILIVPLEAAPEDPPRNITTLEADNIFYGMKLANLSPAYSEEIGTSIYEQGVIVLAIPRSAMRRTSVRRGDVFKAVNGDKVMTIKDIQDALYQDPRNIDFTISRAGRQIDCIIRRKGRSYCK
ncbi:MAG: hypothetical protein COB49_04390, partial [Alphaproteobacteria bacterium]